MTTNYFRQFPLVEYKFGNEESKVNFQNLTVYIDALDQVKEYGTFYQNYQIQNGERPDHVSYKIYGTTDYYWTFWLLNDKLKEQGWPIDNSQLYLRAQQYYPHFTFRVSGEALSNSLGVYKPLSSSPTFKLGSYVWLRENKLAGQIIKIDYDLGQITLDFNIGSAINVAATTTVNTNPNLDLGQTGILTSNLITTSEFSAKLIMNNQNVAGQEGQDHVPPSDKQFEVMRIIQAYKQYDAPHHYEDAEGKWIKPTYAPTSPHAYDWTSVTTQQSVSNFQRLREVNDEQRSIKVLKRDVISQVVSEYNSLLTGSRR
jgi:hypothetical protein